MKALLDFAESRGRLRGQEQQVQGVSKDERRMVNFLLMMADTELDDVISEKKRSLARKAPSISDRVPHKYSTRSSHRGLRFQPAGMALVNLIAAISLFTTFIVIPIFAPRPRVLMEQVSTPLPLQQLNSTTVEASPAITESVRLMVREGDSVYTISQQIFERFSRSGLLDRRDSNETVLEIMRAICNENGIDERHPMIKPGEFLKLPEDHLMLKQDL